MNPTWMNTTWKKAWDHLRRLTRPMAWAIGMACLATPLSAQVRPSDDGTWYYEIGGADPYMFGYTNNNRIPLGVGANWNIGNVCSFDPRTGITDTFANAKQGINNLFSDVIDNAPALVAGWGISKLQEANPGLYDLISKGLVDARNIFSASVKSCQQIASDNRNHRNPVDGWLKVSLGEAWKKKTQEGGSAVEAEEEITENPGEEGITWVGGEKAGGEGQPAIETIGDTVGVGYEQLGGGNGTTNTQSPNEGSGDGAGGADDGCPELLCKPETEERVARIWDTEEKARDWVTSVVGEQEIRVCNNCEKMKTQIGEGLRLHVKREKQKVDEKLAPMLQTHAIPTTAELDEISVPGMGIMITENVILSLREEPGPERVLLANRLSTEVALARTVEKALVALDLLKTGKQEANIAANGEAVEAIERSIERLQGEIDGILYERNVRQQVLADTARMLSERYAGRQAQSDSSQAGQPAIEPLPMLEGGSIPLQGE